MIAERNLHYFGAVAEHLSFFGPARGRRGVAGVEHCHVARLRWTIEFNYKQLKGERGLDRVCPMARWMTPSAA